MHPEKYWNGFSGTRNVPVQVSDERRVSPDSTITKVSEGVATRSVASKSTTSIPVRASTRFDDIVLRTEGSKMNICRMNPHENHFATEASKNAHSCQLHYWATGKRYRKGIAHCPTCNVNLCLKCFAPFHLVRDLFGMKENLSATYAQDASKGENESDSKKRKRNNN